MYVHLISDIYKYAPNVNMYDTYHLHKYVLYLCMIHMYILISNYIANANYITLTHLCCIHTCCIKYLNFIYIHMYMCENDL